MTLLYIPGGSFTMGTSSNEWFDWPAHTVTLDAFWIDRTEVTNKMYSLCVDAGACNEPIVLHSYSHPSYFGNPEFDNYPVIYADWNMAKTYCEWAGRRLPTEAEWEKAARGEDGRTYPWGNDEPTHDLANYGGVMKDTTEVGKYPAGASPYGVLDMAGNVSEWVADWYSETYDASRPLLNPRGPESGSARVAKGGGWSYAAKALPSAIHIWNSLGPLNSLGFRCAFSP